MSLKVADWDDVARFASWYSILESGCWQWNGALSNGYGTFHAKGRNFRAHRFSYFLAHRDWPLCTDHLCRNRACVNPAHLESVTVRENTLRGLTIPAHNLTKTHCPKGHEYSEANTYRHPTQGRRCRKCDSLLHLRRKREKREREASNVGE